MMTWLAGCGAMQPVPPRDPDPVTWEVAAVVAIGRSTVEEHYRLRTERVGRDTWAVSTVRTELVVDGADGSRRTWSSETIAPGDPWPFVLQHAVASVPAFVRFESGRPMSVDDPQAWSAAARAAIDATGLPPEASAAGENLIDPEGVVRDLARLFPGSPSEGHLTGTERFAGIEGRRDEVCEGVEATDRERFRCAGSAVAADGSDRLSGFATWTEVVADSEGLVWMESAFGGTVVTRDGAGRRSDIPVAGHRRVERR